MHGCGWREEKAPGAELMVGSFFLDLVERSAGGTASRSLAKLRGRRACGRSFGKAEAGDVVGVDAGICGGADDLDADNGTLSFRRGTKIRVYTVVQVVNGFA